MELLLTFVDIILHLNKHLDKLVANYGLWVYLILFLIIFCETGLVVTPFLPGDSLLFAVGAMCATGTELKLSIILVSLSIAAIIGDSLNYWIGHFFGSKVFKGNSRFFNKKHLDRTHDFYERYGGKTIIIARFVPIIRTFAPFVAGMGKMTWVKFMTYNVSGGLLWIFSVTLAGYYFGTLKFVKENFSLVILMIIIISILPAVFEIWRESRRLKAMK